MKKIIIATVLLVSLTILPSTASAQSAFSRFFDWLVPKSTNSGIITATISPSSPLERIVQISNTEESQNIVLAKYDIKSKNQDSIVKALNFTINITDFVTSSIFNRIKIQVDGQTYTAASLTKGGNQVNEVLTASFTDLDIRLSKDTVKTVTVLADAARPSSSGILDGVKATVTLQANNTNIAAEDNFFNRVSVNTATLRSSKVTFMSQPVVGKVSISSQSATARVNLFNNYPVSATIGFTFTFNNTGTIDLYIAKEANTALATSSTVGIAAYSTINSAQTVTSPSSLAGDTSTAWIIPSGTSRTFVYTGLIRGRGRGVGQNESTSITQVYFSDATDTLQEFNVDSGLERLVTPSVFIEDGIKTTDPSVMITPTIPAVTSGDTKELFILPAGTSRQFVISNNSNNDFFINKNSTLVYKASSPDTRSGDTSTTYIVPAGTSRTIRIDNTNSINKDHYLSKATLSAITSTLDRPTITRVSPSSTNKDFQFYPGDTITIEGAWLANNGAVRIGDTAIQLNGDGKPQTRLTLSVPANLIPGIYMLYVDGPALVTNKVKVTVLARPSTSPVPFVKPIVCPAGYICKPPGVPDQCPAGYTCKPVTFDCPTGYTCTTQSLTPQTVQPATTCSLTSNKSVYQLGETITYSWTSQNATYASWQKDTSGKDHLWLPGDKLAANGSQQVTASVSGNPPVTLLVSGYNASGSCSTVVNVVAPSTAPIPSSSPSPSPISSGTPKLSASTPVVSGSSAGSGRLYTGNMSIISTVTNTGTASSQAGTAYFQYSTDGSYFSDWGYVSLPSISQGSSYNTSYTWTGGVGTWYFRLKIDNSNYSSPITLYVVPIAFSPSSSVSSSPSPTGSGVSRSVGENRSQIASIFYAIGDMLDSSFSRN